jgi:hypothetical protein
MDESGYWVVLVLVKVNTLLLCYALIWLPVTVTVYVGAPLEMSCTIEPALPG